MGMECGRMRGLASDPDFTALEMFFFPDRYDFLEPVNREAAGVEGFPAMGRRHRDRHRDFADFHHADTMLDRDPHDAETLACFIGKLAYLAQRHRLVGLVL